MKVLFLGNSYTYFNDLPAMVQWMAEQIGLDLQTDSVTRGGAYLHQFADPADGLYAAWTEKYRNGTWDAVVCQNQSFHPVKDPAAFRQAAMDVQALCQPGQKFYFYQTWAYQYGSEKLASTGLAYEEMLEKMVNSYAGAAAAVNGDVVPVGEAFAQVRTVYPEIVMYNPDGSHPSPAGTYLAACIFLTMFARRSPLDFPVTEGVAVEDGDKLRKIVEQWYYKAR